MTMTREAAIHFLRQQVAALEPARPCPQCVMTMFPRPFPGGEWATGGMFWKPGLMMAPEHQKWWRDFHAWERDGEQGPMPRPPKTPFYVECTTCQGSGIEEPGRGPWHEALAALEKPDVPQVAVPNQPYEIPACPACGVQKTLYLRERPGGPPGNYYACAVCDVPPNRG